MTNAERQRAFKERQAINGRRQVNLWLTEEEQFYLERVLEQMRKEGSVPAQMRRRNGTMSTLDA